MYLKMAHFKVIRCLASIALLLFVVGQHRAPAAQIIYASAAMGPSPQGSGLPLSSTNFIGWRFKTTTPLSVTQVGGHLGALSGNLFAAIVPLTAIDALPTGAPFETGVEVPHATFTASLTTADVRVPLVTLLQPGSYALVMGSGQFDAAGNGWMPNAQQANIDPTTQSTYIAWKQTLPGKYAWTAGAANNVRLVVIGTPTAGPSDFNQDTHIDGQDLAAWTSSFASPGATPMADANGDSRVDGADFLAWQRAQRPTPAATTVTPEPHAAVLLTVAALTLLRRVRSSR
jgi:hypothetical protein